MTRLRGRRRHDEQREHEQRAGDLAGRRDGDPEHHEEHDRQHARPGTPRAAATSGSTDANSNGRRDRAEHHEQTTATTSSAWHLRVGDAEEAAEQQRAEAVEEAAVEAHEQEPARERERLHRADDRGLLAERVPRSLRGTAAMTTAAAMQNAKNPRPALDPSQTAPAAPGKADDDEGVAGEGLPAQHHEPTDDPGDDRDDRAGPERVDHEVELEQLPDVVDEVPGEPWSASGRQASG